MIKERIVSIVIFLLYIGVIATNALANILPINGYNTGELSDMLPNLFVPAGITFSIWGVIYLLLGFMSIYMVYLSFIKVKKDLCKFRMVLGANYCLNILWIILWHYRMINLSLIVMLGLLISLIYLSSFMEERTVVSVMDTIAFKWSIGVYFGWISVATIANVTAVLVSLNWKGFGLSDTFWATTMIIIGFILASIILFRKKNIPYSLVFVWAYTGIFLKRLNTKPYNSTVALTALGLGIVIFILALVTYIKNRPKRLVM